MHNEKLKRSQRLALSGVGVSDDDEELLLRVVQHPNDPEVSLRGLACDARYDTVCYLHPRDYQALSQAGGGAGAAAGACSAPLFVYARTFPKMVLRARPHDDCPVGCIVMSEIQRQNLEVTNRDKFEFRKYQQHAMQPDLRLVHLEVRARRGDGVVIRNEAAAAQDDSIESESEKASETSRY